MSTEIGSSNMRVKAPTRPPRPIDSFPLPPQPVKSGPITRQPFSINRNISKTTTTRNISSNYQFKSRVATDQQVALANQSINIRNKGGYRSNERRNSHPPTIIPPKSDSLNSLASTNSTTSSTFGLASPFPRPQNFKPTLQQEDAQHIRSYDKENIASTSAIPFDSSPVTHIRLRNSPSLDGFPYRSSSALAFSGHSNHYEGNKVREEGESTDEDVDLDLSFDLHPTTRDRNSSLLDYAKDSIIPEDNVNDWPGGGGNVRCPTRRVDSFSSDELERDLAEDRSIRRSTSESEVVRSDSGQLLGNKQKLKSVLGLRQAYFDGERALDAQGGNQINQKRLPTMTTARTEWVRKTSLDPTLNLSSIARKRSDVPTYHHSLGNGFAFNPTDPLNIPLPESPATTPSTPLEAKKSKVFRLPLKLVEKRKSINPLASPAWSISSFFTPAQVKEPIVAITADILVDYVPSKRASQDLRLSHEFEESQRASWAGDLTKSALDLLSGRRSRPGTPHNRRNISTPSEEDSPMFGGSTPSDFHISSDEMIRTPRDTSLYIYNDTEEEEEENHQYYSYSEQPVEVDLGRPRSQLRKDALAGLGLDFSGNEEGNSNHHSHQISIGQRSLPHFAGRPRSFQRPQIPSLSLSPPPLSDIEDDDDDDLNSSLQSSQSDIESLNILSRRASRILASPSTLSIGSENSSQSPDYLVSAARPHFGTGLRGLYPTASQSNSQEIIASPVPSPRSANNRFSFIPVSLNLVNHKRQLPISNYDSMKLSSPIVLLSPPSVALRAPHRSSFVNSITSTLSSSPRSKLDEMVPAKLLFLAGFLFGPWCWILGGWWLRGQDGELWKTRGSRCREENCCSGSMKRSHHPGVRRQETTLKWGEVDQFVFLNRVAGVGSGVITLGLVVGALFVAVVGA